MKKLILSLTIILLFCTVKSYGQTTATLYEFVFNFPGNQQTYSAILNRSKNATGYIRIRFLDATNNPVVQEFEIDEHFDSTIQSSYASTFNGPIDSTKLCFTARKPRTIIGDSKAQIGNLVFQFEIKYPTDSTEIFEPLQIINTDPKSGKIFYARAKNSKLITTAELTPDFLNKYFKPGELFQANGSTTNQLVKADTIYFISVANTNALNIGKSCNTDKVSMKAIFTAIARTLKLPLKSIEIFGEDFNADNVHDAIDKLHPGKNDIILFYYSGHGFEDRSPTIKFPKMDLRAGDFDPLDNSLEFQTLDIFNQLIAKNARFILMLSDCCNAVPGAQIPISKNAPSTRSSPLPFNEAICQKLFLSPAKFSVLMTAANKGELAAGFESDGGIFTFNFRETLVNLLSPVAKIADVNWNKILNDTQINTIKKAPNAICAESKNANKKCDQHPIKEIIQ